MTLHDTPLPTNGLEGFAGPAAVGTAELTEVDRYVLAVRLKGYLGAHHDAVALADEAVARHPGSVRLLRLRGEKRFIVRELGAARDDFEAAVALLGGQGDELEFYQPDVERDVVSLVLGRGDRFGQQQRSKGTVHSATWYYAGVARYLDGEYAAAVDAFVASQAMAVDGHLGVAGRDWQYLSLRRLGRHDDAERCLVGLDALDEQTALHPGTGDVSRSLTDSFLMRLRMYRGEVGPADLLRNDTTSPLALATLGYGVGAWYLSHGHAPAAERTWRRVLELGEWASSGAIAAEVDLRRL